MEVVGIGCDSAVGDASRVSVALLDERGTDLSGKVVVVGASSKPSLANNVSNRRSKSAIRSVLAAARSV